MTYAQLASKVIQELTSIYDEREARAIQRFLFRELQNDTSFDCLLSNQNEANNEFIEQVFKYMPYLLKYKPIQYVIGKAWFNDMPFKVSPDVLIPRTETEQLVQLITKSLNSSNEYKILDIGTGSGVIAITLAKLIPDAEVSAIDVSEKALEIARENAELHHVKINFHKLDILISDRNEEDSTNEWFINESFDIIVSNPPYVKESELKLMENNVTEHEPHLALFVSDDDPLIFYRSIIKFAKNHLKQHGSIWFEINETESDNLIALLEAYKYTNIKLFHDLNERPRFISALK